MTCDEARRLALSPAAEALLRRHHHGDDTCGLLCVDQVITGGSGAEAGLEPGDLLLSCGDKRFPDFDALESYLDANVDRAVQLSIERGGASKSIRPARAESAPFNVGATALRGLTRWALFNGGLCVCKSC